MIRVARKTMTEHSKICRKVRSLASEPNPSNGPTKFENVFRLKILSAKHFLASFIDLARCKVGASGLGDPRRL
jgi:hypothetical protein